VVTEADGDNVAVPLLVLVPVPLPLVDGVGVDVMLVLGLAVGVTVPVAESELVGDSVALTEPEPLAVIEADEVRVAEAATRQASRRMWKGQGSRRIVMHKGSLCTKAI
jgi:hypothetical protein